MKLTEDSARKFNYRKWKIPIIIASVAIIVSLIFLLVWVYYIVPYYIVPSEHGDQFVSFSPKLVYVAGPGNPTIEVVYINGSVVPVAWIGLHVNVTNSYFVPVEVSYNGFEFVWLIYNQTVTDPTDVVGNNDYLVWGAFYAGYYVIGAVPMFGFYGDPGCWSNTTGYESAYDYYAAHKDQSNYTKTIAVGTHQHLYVFESASTSPLTAWGGQNYKTHQPVSPGTYHIYVIAYGKVNAPINITVNAVFWGQ